METKFMVMIAGGVTIAILATLIISLVTTSLHKLDTDEVGLMYDHIQKKLSDTPRFEGLHSGPPGYSFVNFSSVFTSIDFSRMSCLNRDGVNIVLTISYQYRVRAKDLYIIVTQFKDEEGFAEILQSIGEAAIHDACAKFNTTQFQSERGTFQEEVRKRVVEKYDDIDCDVTDVQVNDISRPSSYEDSVRNKETAREDIEVAKEERPRKLTGANTYKREAQTQANITVAKANSDARIATNTATSQAASILNEYKKEAETYKQVMSPSGLGLNAEGFLSYMGVRTISSAMNSVYVGMKGPAKTSYVPA